MLQHEQWFLLHIFTLPRNLSAADVLGCCNREHILSRSDLIRNKNTRMTEQKWRMNGTKLNYPNPGVLDNLKWLRAE